MTNFIGTVKVKRIITIFVFTCIFLFSSCAPKDENNVEVKESTVTSSEEVTDSQETDTVIPEPQVAEEEPRIIEPDVVDSVPVFENFGEMDYALFLETNVGYGATLDYFKYGIYGDFTSTAGDGENIYFLLNEKILGNKMALSTHKDWADYTGEHITSITPDLEWIISRKFDRFEDIPLPWYYLEKWYRNGEEVKTLDIDTTLDMRQFVPQKTVTGEYEAMSEQKCNEVEQMLDEIYDNLRAYNDFCEGNEKWVCFDEHGELLAVRKLKNETGSIYSVYEENCIQVYDISKEQIEMLCELTLPKKEMAWPIEISQIVGTQEEGWLVFSEGDTTYRMNYPSGDIEELGEFMYGTTYSPDGRYMAYCTGYFYLYYCWEFEDMKMEEYDLYYEMLKRWDAIAPGWYVKDLETGNTTYIPIATWKLDDSPLYGGRCIWIEKDKLLEIINGGQTYYEKIIHKGVLNLYRNCLFMDSCFGEKLRNKII